MILQALNDYYNRLKEDPDVNIPLRGFSKAKIHFEIVLAKDGTLLDDNDRRVKEKKKTLPIMVEVPEAAERTVKITPNFLWDNTSYVLGADDKGKPERAAAMFKAFKKLAHEIGDDLEDEGMNAVLAFLDSWSPEKVESLKNWDEMCGLNVVFRLDMAREFVHDRKAIRDAWLEYYGKQESEETGLCLVTGEEAPIARLHPKIKGVPGAQTAGASLVSFNLSAFTSYNKAQSFNSPVSEDSAFAYGTALNWLLQNEKRRIILPSNTTVVFWTENQSDIEDMFPGFINPENLESAETDAGKKAEDDNLAKNVCLRLEAIVNGERSDDFAADNPFYILGLAPNAARLSVRFWHVCTTGEIQDRIGDHFRDLQIVKSYDKDLEFPPLWRMLNETAVLRKRANVSPSLEGAVMRAFWTGGEYPKTLLSAVITRIRSDQTVNYLRAAMIKAYLARLYRVNEDYKTNQNSMEVKHMLDKDNENVPYRLGRLFSVLEKIQKDAIEGVKAGIVQRFLSSASATPRVAFPRLLQLAQNHMGKLQEPTRIFHERNIQEIVEPIREFPVNLSLEEQGLFFLGYYHQKQALYAKKDKKTDSEVK